MFPRTNAITHVIQIHNTEHKIETQNRDAGRRTQTQLISALSRLSLLAVIRSLLNFSKDKSHTHYAQ